VIVVALALTVLLMPFPLVVASFREPADPGGVVGMFVSDVPAAVLVVWLLARTPALLRRPSMLTWGAVALLALMLLALVLHPSVAGVQFVLRCLAILAIAAALAAIDPRSERVVLALLIGSTLAQAAIAGAQLVASGPVGLSVLGEWQVPLDLREHELAPRGTMVHEYSLTVLALVTGAFALRVALRSVRPALWILPAAAGLLIDAFTYSRSALFAVLVAIGALVPGARRRRPAHIVGIVALTAVVALGAALAGSEWLARLVPEPKDDPEHVACGRLALLTHGVTMASLSPFVGVGPSRYGVVLRKVAAPGSIEQCLMTPHNVPLLFAAEDGLLAGTLLVVLLAALGLRALRSGPTATAVFVTLAPFLVFDDFPFHVHGVVLAGMWLGLLERAARDPDLWD
jgi:hypothetical protein